MQQAGNGWSALQRATRRQPGAAVGAQLSHRAQSRSKAGAKRHRQCTNCACHGSATAASASGAREERLPTLRKPLMGSRRDANTTGCFLAWDTGYITFDGVATGVARTGTHHSSSTCHQRRGWLHKTGLPAAGFAAHASLGNAGNGEGEAAPGFQDGCSLRGRRRRHPGGRGHLPGGRVPARRSP